MTESANFFDVVLGDQDSESAAPSQNAGKQPKRAMQISGDESIQDFKNKTHQPDEPVYSRSEAAFSDFKFRFSDPQTHKRIKGKETSFLKGHAEAKSRHGTVEAEAPASDVKATSQRKSKRARLAEENSFQADKSSSAVPKADQDSSSRGQETVNMAKSKTPIRPMPKVTDADASKADPIWKKVSEKMNVF